MPILGHAAPMLSPTPAVGLTAVSFPALAATAASIAAVAASAVAALRAFRAQRDRADAAERRVRALLGLVESDRHRLAKRLHDGPVQDLLAYEMEAGVTAHVEGEAAEPSTEVSSVVRDLRDVSEGLRPPALDSFGLAAAVEALAERFRDRHPGIEVDLDLTPVDLGPHVRLALFRVVQEALRNAAAHGPPRGVSIRLAATGAGAELSVIDDGAGYDVPADVNAFAETGRYGVVGMAAHAEAVGGELHLESRPGRTSVRVLAPRSAPV